MNIVHTFGHIVCNKLNSVGIRIVNSSIQSKKLKSQAPSTLEQNKQNLSNFLRKNKNIDNIFVCEIWQIGLLCSDVDATLLFTLPTGKIFVLDLVVLKLSPQ